MVRDAHAQERAIRTSLFFLETLQSPFFGNQLTFAVADCERAEYDLHVVSRSTPWSHPQFSTPQMPLPLASHCTGHVKREGSPTASKKAAVVALGNGGTFSPDDDRLPRSNGQFPPSCTKSNWPAL